MTVVTGTGIVDVDIARRFQARGQDLVLFIVEPVLVVNDDVVDLSG
jgi:hypothetical protein